MAPKKKETQNTQKNGVSTPKIETTVQVKRITQNVKAPKNKLIASVGTRVQPARKAKMSSKPAAEPTTPTLSGAEEVSVISCEELGLVGQATPRSSKPQRETKLIDISLSQGSRDYVRCNKCGIICASRVMIVEHFAFCKENDTNKRDGFVIFYSGRPSEGLLFDSDSGKKIPYNQFKDNLNEKCTSLRALSDVSMEY